MPIRGRGKSKTPGTMKAKPGHTSKNAKKAVSAKILALKTQEFLLKAPESYSVAKKVEWARTQVLNQFRLKQNSR